MIPWERDVYISLLVNYIKEENEKERKRQEKWHDTNGIN